MKELSDMDKHNRQDYNGSGKKLNCKDSLSNMGSHEEKA